MKTVLLVEDNEDDIFFMRSACERTGVPHSLLVLKDGDSAIQYLAGVNEYADRAQFPAPHLIFLDIKLPRRNGHEVLEWIRDQSELEHLPVVMLTNSDEPAEIERAYKLGVTSYLVKNADPDAFNEGVRIVLKYWLQLNTTPAP